MNRKTRIAVILVSATMAGAAVYFLATRKGRKSWEQWKKDGKETANLFTTFGEELARNMEQEQKEEQARELKALVKETLLA